MNEKKRMVFICGGGTGGHIYPAIEFAKAFQRQAPDLDVQFIGAVGGLEETLVPKAGLPLRLLRSGKFNKVSPLEKIKTLLLLPFSIAKGWLWCLRDRPLAVLGVGGFASFPIVLGAIFAGRRVYLWEPNAFPGIANRKLAFGVKKIFVVFQNTARFFPEGKVIWAGMPVRKEIEALFVRSSSTPHQPLHFLVFGGSQGAHFINTLVSDFLLSPLSRELPIQWVLQTGPKEYEDVRLRLRDRENVEVLPYIHDMSTRLEWADMVISRAGTGTISELMAAGKPSLLIPLPTAADNHQFKNADILKGAGAAFLCEQKDLDVEKFGQILRKIVSGSTKLQSMGKQARELFRAGAAEKITGEILTQAP